LAGHTGPDGGLRNVLVRVRGPGAALVLGLEAGAHRFIGIAKESPCHLVVRCLAFTVDFDDAAWLKLGALAAPAVAPRGKVDREYPDADTLIVRGATLAMTWRERWARLEEIGLAVLAAELAAGRSVDEAYRHELVDDDDDDAAADDDDAEADR
jgi:hypothetical protein